MSKQTKNLQTLFKATSATPDKVRQALSHVKDSVLKELAKENDIKYINREDTIEELSYILNEQ